jgi:serine/threonine protein kinase
MSTAYCPSCLTTHSGSPPRCPNLGCGRERPERGWGRILGPGELIDRHYRVARVLALGGAGLTYLAHAIDAEGAAMEPALAIKVLFEERASGSFLRRLANEAQLLQDLDHDHIVRSRGFVQRAGQAPYLVTLFEAGGTLQRHVERVGPLPSEAACSVLSQVLKALSMAHSSGVVHRDLKPANVLLAQDTAREQVPWVRVADFGIAKQSAPIGAGLTQAGAFIGTPEYAAPEQLEGLPPSPATDIFSAAGLLFYMLTGRPPLLPSQRQDPDAVARQLAEQLPYRLPVLGRDPGQHALLQGVMDRVAVLEPERRWSIPRILEELAPLVLRPQRPAATPAPPSPDTRRAQPTMAEWTSPGPTSQSAYERTILEPPPLAQDAPANPPCSPEATFVEPIPSPPARPSSAPSQAQPRALSLDDLFGSSSPTPRPPPPAPGGPSLPVPSPEPRAPSPRDDPFAALGGRGAPVPEPFDPFGKPTASAPEPPPPVQCTPFGTWAPSTPLPLPAQLPTAPTSLLGLLGSVRAEHRPVVVATLEALPRPELSRAMRAWRPGSDAAQGRGAALAIAAIGGSELASIARGLTRARDPSVRACAAEALGAVAKGSLLASLGRMVDDEDPGVRAAAAQAIGLACARSGDQALGRSWLQRMARERDEVAAQARDAALSRLA